VKNEAEAAGYFKFVADQRHVDGQSDSALCLEAGRSVVKDEAETAGYFKLAADQNDASSETVMSLALRPSEVL
jgi:TPR repeat protein